MSIKSKYFKKTVATPTKATKKPVTKPKTTFRRRKMLPKKVEKVPKEIVLKVRCTILPNSSVLPEEPFFGFVGSAADAVRAYANKFGAWPKQVFFLTGTYYLKAPKTKGDLSE